MLNIVDIGFYRILRGTIHLYDHNLLYQQQTHQQAALIQFMLILIRLIYQVRVTPLIL